MEAHEQDCDQMKLILEVQRIARLLIERHADAEVVLVLAQKIEETAAMMRQLEWEDMLRNREEIAVAEAIAKQGKETA